MTIDEQIIVSGPHIGACIFYELCERFATHEEAFYQIVLAAQMRIGAP
jgi:hypothetical protein